MRRRFVGMGAVAAAACTLVLLPEAASGVVVEEVCFDRSSGFADASGMTLGGSAQVIPGGTLRLTPASRFLAGIAFANQELNLTTNLGFDSTFTFRMDQRGGIGDEDGPGADGIAFIFENAPSPSAGADGFGIGYHGLANSLAVEFDTYRNLELDDPNGDHISIHTRGTAPNSAHESASLGLFSPAGQMADGQVHTARIQYLPPGVGDAPGLTVFYDGTEVLHVAVDLATTLNLNAGNGYVGLSAATGDGFENHDILTWQACTSDGRPDPVAQAEDDSYSTDEDTPLHVASPGVLGNDTASGGPITVTVVAGPSHGTLDLHADGSFSYTPAPDFAGTDSFEYRLCAGTSCDNALVEITVNEVSADSALIANPAVATVLPDARIWLTLSARLTSGGAPQAGQTIRFVVGTTTVCSAKTDADGVASCGNTLPILLATALRLGYTAYFDGSPDLHPATARGPIIQVGGIRVF